MSGVTYKTFKGVKFFIDRPKGSVKTWPSGKTFTYPCSYGGFSGRTATDGEGLDAFLGDDPEGHYEVFSKFMTGPTGKSIFDEHKFLVAVSTADRKKIYGLYGDEAKDVKKFKSFDDLMAHVEGYYPKKKDRYASQAKQAAFLPLVRLFLKQAALDVRQFQALNRDPRSVIVDPRVSHFQSLAEENSRDEKLNQAFMGFDRQSNSTGEENSAGIPFQESKVAAFDVTRALAAFEAEKARRATEERAKYPASSFSQPELVALSQGSYPLT